MSRLRGRAVQRTSHDSKEFGAFCFGGRSQRTEVPQGILRKAGTLGLDLTVGPQASFPHIGASRFRWDDWAFRIPESEAFAWRAL
jgi:hypothetical protein